MSRHRSAVEAAGVLLSRAAASGLSAEALESMRTRGIDHTRIDLFPGQGTRAGVTDELASHVGLAWRTVSIADLREADILVTVQFSTRDAVCTVHDSAASRRRIIVADVVVKARINTKWLHIWWELEKRIDWPGESVGSRAAQEQVTSAGVDASE
jgi:hypothetical protein